MGVHISEVNAAVAQVVQNGSAELEWSDSGCLKRVSIWKDIDGTIAILDIACAENGWSFQPVNPPWFQENPTTDDIRNAVIGLCTR